ncbi:sulfite exporter TauE/SafE family protein [Sulfitobacter pseudonitzschiae]|uniref:Probable membrane transporter protein n=1 Tax=Pseudosulfitobacter pseudonitzschiae TaxID=1402135 RepID=A0A9Q2NQE6_9RHOB|nr:sulfite exporter TauE/SafE family protein [Pseudosulfitobacter pseudonitzschiae]MBM2294926.1 sulfite exporter TauE/SafE family protein [Pseudosulfitobacter pseudonitzschiae]MBM2299842.1 sulfite exporter TauE/SafE family protein [Pseudosulfitobacter pseudonitzschiae]MBM2304763.1 sulfite exporter TauE/SafE family protein [Pseudosulfitobacter pseudonitzschiae]MBM2314537.1 sulfite exporter TauE/SafE family protein [Pseudosulfitobacter pseudonitzschiae]MBM2319447.1 sulfite exporter TauE/SafE fam
MIESDSVLAIGAILAVIAMLYSSVGHGGASGYIAVLALLNVVPDVIRPVALSLNVVVAGFATYRFAKAGFIEWRSALPIILASMPLAFLGGGIALPVEIYRPLLGGLLVFSALYLLWQTSRSQTRFDVVSRKIPLLGSVGAGAGIGFLSGLTGIGGGVLLSPLFLISGWAGARQTAGIAAVFILANSVAGLAGNYVVLRSIPYEILPWSGMVLVGSFIGTSLGVRILPVKPLIWLLAVAAMISGVKFLFL